MPPASQFKDKHQSRFDVGIGTQLKACVAPEEYQEE